MTKILPLWVDLIFGVLYGMYFTGTWVLLQDLQKLNTRLVDPQQRLLVSNLLSRINFRRIASLLAGVVFIALHFYEIEMNGISAVIFGILWLDSLNLMGKARKHYSEIARYF